jgi:hypothetical protein
MCKYHSNYVTRNHITESYFDMIIFSEQVDCKNVNTTLLFISLFSENCFFDEKQEWEGCLEFMYFSHFLFVIFHNSLAFMFIYCR